MRCLFIIVALILVSCDSGNIYFNSGFGWRFTVKNSSIERTDTLSLSEGDFWYPKLKWDLKVENGGYAVEKLFTDNSEMIKLPSPFGFYLNKIELVPHPEIHFPINTGDSYESNYKADSQDKSVDNLNVEGTLIVVGKVLFGKGLLKDSSWVINAEGNSSKGKFTSTYYFHEKYGFVYFKYYLGKDTIEIELNQFSVTEEWKSKQ